MSLIEKIAREASNRRYAAQTRKSIQWFKQRVKNISKVNRNQLLENQRFQKRSEPKIGNMYHFFYDPKHKETLPYYDRFPLIFMVGPAEGGFYGLNLHYLAPRERAIFFERLMSLRNNDKLNQTTRLKLSYNILQAASKLKQFQPCFKHYLFNHVKSPTVEIPAVDWEVVLFLPTDSFVYKSRQQVWKKSSSI
jgi:hypothetical protein